MCVHESADKCISHYSDSIAGFVELPARMRFSIAALALPIGFAVSQGVTSAIAPKASAPAGCSANYNGPFQIEVVNVTKSAKRDVVEVRPSQSYITRDQQ